MKHFLLHSAAAFALISAASAADFVEPMISEAPPVIVEQAPWNWTGVYVGGHGGWGWAQRDWDGEFFFGPIDDDRFRYDMDGPVLGGQVGANLQWQSLVIGVEADISWTGLEDSVFECFSFDDECGDFDGLEDLFDVGIEATAEVEWLASARGRLGFAWDRVLLFGTGGVAFAEVETNVFASCILVCQSDTDSARHTGWVGGGGVEVLATANLTARLEYLHYEFDDEDFDYNLVWLSSDDDTFGEADLDVDVIRAAVNVLF